MKNRITLVAKLLTIGLLCVASAFGAGSQFEADCRAIAATDHRLTGSPEYQQAAQYVEGRLRAIGVDQVLTQPFRAAQTKILRCEMQIGNQSDNTARRIALYPMRPNAIMPPVSPASGIQGKLVHLGAGELSDLSKVVEEGTIAILDYNAGRNWLRAFRMGARAVVFTGQDSMQAWQAHYLEQNVNLPRYFYSGPASDLPEGAMATIQSEIVWETVEGRNVYGFLRGTAPVFHLEEEEVVVLAANLDTYGEIPRLSPGARGAANCAGLLKLAEHLLRERPKRHILLAFYDGQSRGHEGVGAFYRVFEEEKKDARLVKRYEYYHAEEEYLSDVVAALALPDPLQAELSDVRRGLLTRLRTKAEQHAYAVSDTLLVLRKAKAALPASEVGQRSRTDGLIQDAKNSKSRWNDLRRALRDVEFNDKVASRYAKVLSEVKADILLRQQELAWDHQMLVADTTLKKLLGEHWIVLHASLLLGDQTPRWGIAIGGDSQYRMRLDRAGLYGRVQAAFLAAKDSLPQSGRGVPNFEIASVNGTLERTSVLVGAPYFTHSGEIAGSMGIYNFVFATSQELLEREGTPQDKLAFLDLARIEQQVREVGILIGEAANQERLSLRRAIMEQEQQYPTVFKSNRPGGPMVMATTTGSSVPNKPMPGATIHLTCPNGSHRTNWLKRRDIGFDFRSSKIHGFDDYKILRSNQNGTYYYGPAPGYAGYHGFTTVTDEKGRIIYTTNLEFRARSKAQTRQNVYRTKHGYVTLFPQTEVANIRVFEAKTNSLLNKQRSSWTTGEGVVSWFSERKIEAIKLFGEGVPPAAFLVNGAPTIEDRGGKGSDPYGKGIPMTGEWVQPAGARQAATDLWRLNESRMQLLRTKGCSNNSLEDLHGRTEDLLDQARKAETLGEQEAIAASAFMMERTIYRKTLGTMDDLVRAVLVLLALSIPFAFAMERLLIGSTLIYRQIAWFVSFFIITFMILYFTHPAFGISATPLIIFLGFAVVGLSSLVIVIVMRKFEVELKSLQGMTHTVHAADVSRFGTVIAAMNMGISTMRRRPLRTALTAITILLLTFTILSFASFGTITGIIKLFLTPPPPYAGVQIHKLDWSELSPGMEEILALRWGENTGICSRYWVTPKNDDSKGVLATRVNGENPVILRGVLGIDGKELLHRRDLADLLGVNTDDIEGRAWITRSVAGRLNISAGDDILLSGHRLKAGVIDPSRFLRIKDMDHSEILPVNFVEMESAMGGQKQAKTVGDDAASQNIRALRGKRRWSNLSGDVVAIVSTETAKRMGASLHGITMYTKESRAATEIAEELARMVTPLPVNATRDDGVYVHVMGPVLQASGAKDLIFPILLGGLVIFGTMLGSVSDREKEIYTFSALGLAPPHVAGLFFAESLVYSVVGGMGGYLLANGLIKILGYLADYGLVRVPEMNYSSGNAVITILIVMGTVLISTIYPAVKASRSANPGVMRSWRLPTPDGSIYNIVFPFTVSDYDITGVVSFLKEHFDGHSETGLGSFMSTGASIVRDESGHLGLNAKLALSPFDLGVTQLFELRSTPSEIAGVDEVKIRIERVSGQPKDWQRLNKVLLDDLRKQFLIWRSLAQENMEIYRSRTLVAIGEKAGEETTEENPA